jgi:hypothetical protein
MECDVEGIKFYSSYYSAIMKIPDDTMRLKAFELVTTYMMTGEILEIGDWQLEILFEGIRPNIDTSRKRSKAGQTTNEKSNGNQNEIKTKSNENQTSNNKNKNKNKNKNIEIEIEKEKKKKHKHGEYAHVLLTDDEKAKLDSEFGEDETAAAIKYLDEYIEMKGTSYKSHYMAMRKWVFDAVKEKSRASPSSDWREEWLREQGAS